MSKQPLQRFLPVYVAFLFFVIAASPLRAQRPSTLRLNRAQATLNGNVQHWLDSFSKQTKAPALILLQLENAPDENAKKRLQESGIQIHQALGGNSFLAEIVAANSARTISGVSGIAAVKPEWKLSPELRKLNGQTGWIDLAVAFKPGTPDEKIRNLIESAGGTLKPSPLSQHGLYEIRLQASELHMLLDRAEVFSVGKAAVDKPLNLESQRATSVNLAQHSQTYGGWGLTGDGITVGVGDNVAGMWSVDTRDRVINYNPLSYANHGQHVNGTVGGSGLMDPRGEGFAPHARLADFFYSLVWSRTADMVQAHDMTLTNNSYANIIADCEGSGTYDAYAEMLDTLTLMYPEVLHIFASGNDGGMSCPPLPSGYGTVTGGYQGAKNILVVGNSDKYYEDNPGTSRGPLKDGRLKPEIAAIGSDVYSTKGNDTYLSASGTSMACPQVTGAAALLQQRYKQTHGGAKINSALLKAVLMNGAKDRGNAGPDFTFGFGVMDLNRSLIMLDSNRYTTGSVQQGNQSSPLSITVPPNIGQLKVMLYWHDQPASPMSSTQLINDLDLQVQKPDASIQLPLVLNPVSKAADDPAVPGEDHLNNVEQVVIDHPVAGNYLVQVKGFTISSGTQDFTIVYDLTPEGIQLSTPFAGEAYQSDYPLILYWEASQGTDNFRIEFSEDDGQNWSLVQAYAKPDARHYYWEPPVTTNSTQCRIRISRNGGSEMFTSGRFTLNQQPVLRLSPVQCPGYAALQWSAVPKADSYLVYQKRGPFLQPKLFLRDTFWTASGLNPDSLYYFAVQPYFSSLGGYRSMGISRMPNSGNCTGSISDGDLMLSRVVSPATGRIGTSSELLANDTVRVEVRNLDDKSVSRYRVAMQVNSGPWSTQVLQGIAAGTSATVEFRALNLSAPGSYHIRAWIENLDAIDPVHSNDTLNYILRQLPNSLLALNSPFIEDFESFPRMDILNDTMGLSPDARWDYQSSNDTGRLRTFIDPGLCITGNRSISLDMQQNATPAFNLFSGTFNLNAMSVQSNEVRVEFDYRLNGLLRSSDSNRVWTRGSDTSQWVQLLAYDFARAGTIVHSGSLSLTDALSAHGQQFSSSTQIGFSQYDEAVIAETDFGSGLTIDNLKMYQVINDAGIAKVINPAPVNCALGNDEVLSLEIVNGVKNELHDIFLFYQLDGGVIVQDTLSLLPAKARQVFSFKQHMDLSALGPHSLRIWLNVAGDNYHTNDSLLQYTFYNQPLIASFPYLQDFENGAGNWYPGGQNSSWEFGAPASKNINKAASGKNAWKTKLNGNYNNNELSYLYSPCFDLSSMLEPMLSFSVNMQIENCKEELCDAAWAEYSYGNRPWNKLGIAGEGTNWYSTNVHEVWTIQGPQRWRVASTRIPKGNGTLRIRFVFASDAGLTMEGFALDDVHVFDRAFESYTQSDLGPLSAQVSGSTFVDISFQNTILAQINPVGKNLGNASLWFYKHESIFDEVSAQYYLPASFVIQSEQIPADSTNLRLYISDQDVVRLVDAIGCAECDKPADAYELGVTRYRDPERSRENNTLGDNSNGSYQFTPASKIRWVPYDAGYYAEFKQSDFGEFWLNSGGANSTFALTKAAVDFQAHKQQQTVVLDWKSNIDLDIQKYDLFVSTKPHEGFLQIASVAALGNNGAGYTYVDYPVVVNNPALYYRLRYQMKSGEFYYAPLRQVIWNGRNADVNVYPIPPQGGLTTIRWTCSPGDQLDVFVTDLTGRKVVEMNSVAADYLNQTALNCGGWAKGIYFLNARINGEQFVYKIPVP